MAPEQIRTLWRLVLVVGGAVLVQLAVIAQFRLFGVVPDIIPVLVVSIGLLGGSTAGATTGFIAGFLIDLTLVQTMGVSSLLLTIAGYFAGRMRELYDPVHPLTSSAVGASANVFFTVGFGVMQFSLGQPAPDPISMLWQVLMSAVWGALLAPLVFRVARWAMLPAIGLSADPVHRRRRATMTSQSVLAAPTIDTRRRRKLGRKGRR
ncbi:MAG: rod shape-determining protein MreD [Solirubrobacterales bacterium]